MAGMTSQPSMGAIVACAKGTKLDTGESHEGPATSACFRKGINEVILFSKKKKKSIKEQMERICQRKHLRVFIAVCSC